MGKEEDQVWGLQHSLREKGEEEVVVKKEEEEEEDEGKGLQGEEGGGGGVGVGSSRRTPTLPGGKPSVYRKPHI